MVDYDCVFICFLIQRTLSSGSSAAAEFIADIFLCPLEATRIRLVSNPTYASGR